MKPLSIIAAIAIVAAGSADNLRGTATTMFNGVNKAFVKKDVAAFRKATKGYFTSDFKDYEGGQTSNYEQTVAGLTPLFAMLTKVDKSETKIISAKETGHSGKVRCEHRILGTMMGPDKKSHKIELHGFSNDTWRKEGGNWKVAVMTWSKQEMKMDGKPFDPNAGAGKGK